MANEARNILKTCSKCELKFDRLRELIEHESHCSSKPLPKVQKAPSGQSVGSGAKIAVGNSSATVSTGQSNGASISKYDMLLCNEGTKTRLPKAQSVTVGTDATSGSVTTDIDTWKRANWALQNIDTPLYTTAQYWKRRQNRKLLIKELSAKTMSKSGLAQNMDMRNAARQQILPLFERPCCWICKFCLSRFCAKKAMNHHQMKVHANQIYYCSYCPGGGYGKHQGLRESYQSYEDLRRHELDTHRATEIFPWRCDQCFLAFKEEAVYNEHTNKPCVKSVDSESGSDQDDDPDDEAMNRFTPFRYGPGKSKMKPTDAPIDSIDSSITIRSTDGASLPLHAYGTYYSLIARKSTGKWGQLFYQSFMCKYCLDTIYGRDNLISHQITDHFINDTDRDTIYFCYECAKRKLDVKFTNAQQLRQHFSNSHSDILMSLELPRKRKAAGESSAKFQEASTSCQLDEDAPTAAWTMVKTEIENTDDTLNAGLIEGQGVSVEVIKVKLEPADD